MPGGWNFSWLTPDLAVGGRLPEDAPLRLAPEHGLGAVIDVRCEDCDDRAAMMAAGVRFLHLPTLDNAAVDQAMLDRGAQFARSVSRDGLKLLIHCEHGIGRSATVALCILVDRGFQPLEALARAKNARALVSPSPAQYEAWSTWLRRRAPETPAPDFDAFRAIAYSHLKLA